MGDKDNRLKGHAVTFTLGAIAGGIFLGWSMNAIPKMVSKIMGNMMERMGESGCSPEEM